MCRALSVHGGRRCPSHSNPGSRRGALLRQQMSRYSRRADSAETALIASASDPDVKPSTLDKLTARMESHLQRFTDYRAEYAAHEKRPPRPSPPPSRAAEFTRESTIDMSDEHLNEQYLSCSRDPDAQDAILAVMEWRDQKDAERDAELAATTRADAETWGDLSKAPPGPPPTDPLHNPFRALTRERTAHERIREEYEVDTHTRYLAAEDQCRGAMLNARGRAKGVDPLTLFSGNATRAARYASDELKAYWRDNGRMTLARYRHETLGWESDRAAATRNKLEDYGDVA